MDDRSELKQKLDETLAQLQIHVAAQLLADVQKGDNLRAAIDFLRLNQRRVTEADVLRSSTDASGYLDDLIETMDETKRTRR